VPVVLLSWLWLARVPEEPTSRRALGSGISTVIQDLRRAVERRAATRLDDDFRSGLGAWRGEAKWAETWSYDAAGFVRPGKLALWVPSLRLADYQMEFLAQIERGGLSWVFRARDLRNYYAARLLVVDEGPSVAAALVRHAVIEGRAGPRERTPLPLALARASMQRVRLEARGSIFALYVNGQLVAHWADERLPSGGIGFFGEPGDRVRLRRVTLSHQDDLLGRLCALLAAPAADKEL